MLRSKTFHSTAVPAARPGLATRLIVALLALLSILSIGVTIDAALRSGLIGGPAFPGDELPLPGGLMVINEVIPEHLAPMQHANFARLGMSMNTMVPDATPEGFRSFTVLLTLAGRDADGLSIDIEQFTVSGSGLEPTAPLRSDIAVDWIAPGNRLEGTLVFRVPETATDLTLRYADGRAVALDPGPGGAGHH